MKSLSRNESVKKNLCLKIGFLSAIVEIAILACFLLFQLFPIFCYADFLFGQQSKKTVMSKQRERKRETESDREKMGEGEGGREREREEERGNGKKLNQEKR